MEPIENPNATKIPRNAHPAPYTPMLGRRVVAARTFEAVPTDTLGRIVGAWSWQVGYFPAIGLEIEWDSGPTLFHWASMSQVLGWQHIENTLPIPIHQ